MCLGQLPDNTLPKQFEGVGIDEHTGSMVPLDLEFVDSNFEKVKLRDLFKGDVPVAITLNYFQCKLLCNVQLEGLAAGLRKVPLPLGEKYKVVTVSIDPRDDATRAREAEKKYLALYDRPVDNARGWHFLTGEDQAIKQLAKAVGFKYHWLEKQQEFSHTAVVVLCSPRGKICRYLYGVEYAPETLRLGLVESSEGKVGNTLDQLILFCSMYTGAEGYKLQALRIMQLGAGGFGVLLAAFLMYWWRREIMAGLLRRNRPVERELIRSEP
jgi:protein SCO1/2